MIKKAHRELRAAASDAGVTVPGTDYSTPASGSYDFAPSVETLEAAIA